MLSRKSGVVREPIRPSTQPDRDSKLRVIGFDDRRAGMPHRVAVGQNLTRSHTPSLQPQASSMTCGDTSRVARVPVTCKTSRVIGSRTMTAR